MSKKASYALDCVNEMAEEMYLHGREDGEQSRNFKSVFEELFRDI